MLTVSDFEQAVGSAFTAEIRDRSVSLDLTELKPIPSSPRPGGGFSLLFKGPRDMALPQATYRLEGRGGAYDIFIVPVAVDPTGYFYEAVFN